MTGRVAVVVVVLSGALAAGCGGTDERQPWGADAGRTVTPRHVGVAVSDRLALPVPAAPTAVPTVDGADVPKDLPADYIDTSVDAQQRFFRWESYEIPAGGFSRGAQADYQAGITSCQMRSKGELPDLVVRYLTSEAGYHGAAAEAIVASALRALCRSGDTGYLTTFDLNVDSFMRRALVLINFSTRVPAYYEFGWFLKETCAAMADPSIGGAGIYDHTVGLTQNGYLTVSQGADTGAINILINEAVQAGCPGYYTNLPPIIQTSS